MICGSPAGTALARFSAAEGSDGFWRYLENRLAGISSSPGLARENARGNDLEDFTRFMRSGPDLPAVRAALQRTAEEIGMAINRGSRIILAAAMIICATAIAFFSSSILNGMHETMLELIP
jgi:hypothetical protein